MRPNEIFIRFSRGPKQQRFVSHGNWQNCNHTEPVKKYLKAVLLGDSLVMQYGSDIVGVAKLNKETDKWQDYDVVVAAKCELGPQKVARAIKDMIGKSEKFSATPSQKRREYYVEEIDCEVLPIKAEIKFTSL